MKKCSLILFFLSCGVANAQYNLINIGFSQFMKHEIATDCYSITDQTAQSVEDKKYTFKNLRLYILKGNDEIRKSAKDLGNYLSLQDAIVKNLIEISEMDGGSVNILSFQNVSTDTILVLAGEIVTGGKQDRVIGCDLLLLPRIGQVKVPVFCVEHGRWKSNGTGESFKGYFGVSSAAVRKQAVVDKNQGGVWKKVAEVNQKNNVNPSTGTYTALKNSESLNWELDAYMKFFEPLVATDTNIIGFVAVTGDTIISCDIFGNNALFKSHAHGLIKAAAVEASTNGSVVTILASQVLAFLTEFLTSDIGQEEKIMEKGTLLMNKGKKVHMNYYKSGKTEGSTSIIHPMKINRIGN